LEVVASRPALKINHTHETAAINFAAKRYRSRERSRVAARSRREYSICIAACFNTA
jgi:hypothetical protein